MTLPRIRSELIHIDAPEMEHTSRTRFNYTLLTFLGLLWLLFLAIEISEFCVHGWKKKFCGPDRGWNIVDFMRLIAV